MFCPQCGFQNPVTANFCEKCGHNLKAAGGDVAPHEHASASSIHIPKMPKNPLGVAQMMLVICLLLTLVIPALGFYQWFIRGFSDTYGIVAAGQFSQLLDAVNPNSGGDIGKEFLQIFTLRIALESPLLIFSLYSGLMLWKKKPGALALAKKFLIALVLFLVCSHLVFPHFFGLSESYNTTLGIEYWLTVVLLAACFFWLAVSNQVRNYYAPPLIPAEESKPA